MDVESVRIMQLGLPTNIRCVPLMDALDRGRIRDSIVLSDTSRFILKHAGIDDFYSINAPVGRQGMKLEFTGKDNPDDISTSWEERTVAATCPSQKCARCILDLTTEDPSLNGMVVLKDLRASSALDIKRFL